MERKKSMEHLDWLQQIEHQISLHQSLWGENHPLLTRFSEGVQSLYKELFHPPQELAAFGVAEQYSTASEIVPLRQWQQEKVLSTKLAEPSTKSALQQLAQLADHLSRPPYSIPVFLPESIGMTEAGEWTLDWPTQCLYQLKPGQTKLSSEQRKARYVMHPGLTRALPEPFSETIPTAMVHSFGRFLLSLCTENSSELIQHQGSQYIRYLVPSLPPEWPHLFHQMLQNGPLQRPTESCIGHWSQMEAAIDKQEQAKTHTPDLSIQPHLASYSVSGRQKPGPMQDTELTSPVKHIHLCLTGVADGMSHAELGSGEIAARECARAFEEVALQQAHSLLDIDEWPASPADFVERSFSEANRAVTARTNLHAANHKTPQELAPMATTMLTATVLGDAAYIAWLGDSVAWHYEAQEGRLTRLTIPHQRLHQRLQEKPFEALSQRSPADQQLYRYVGSHEWHEEDKAYEATPLQPSSLVRVFAPGDLLLLATDGLIEGAQSKGWLEADTQLCQYIQNQQPSVDRLHEFAYKLVEAANQRDGRDNITLIVVGFSKCTEEPEAPEAPEETQTPQTKPNKDTPTEESEKSTTAKGLKKSKSTSRKRTTKSRSRTSKKPCA